MQNTAQDLGPQLVPHFPPFCTWAVDEDGRITWSEGLSPASGDGRLNIGRLAREVYAEHPDVLSVLDAARFAPVRRAVQIHGSTWFIVAGPQLAPAGCRVGVAGTALLLSPPGESLAPALDAAGEICCRIERDIPGVARAGDGVCWSGHRFIHVSPLPPEALPHLPAEFLARVRAHTPAQSSASPPPSRRLQVL